VPIRWQGLLQPAPPPSHVPRSQAPVIPGCHLPCGDSCVLFIFVYSREADNVGHSLDRRVSLARGNASIRAEWQKYFLTMTSSQEQARCLVSQGTDQFWGEQAFPTEGGEATREHAGPVWFLSGVEDEADAASHGRGCHTTLASPLWRFLRHPPHSSRQRDMSGPGLPAGGAREIWSAGPDRCKRKHWKTNIQRLVPCAPALTRARSSLARMPVCRSPWNEPCPTSLSHAVPPQNMIPVASPPHIW